MTGRIPDGIRVDSRRNGDGNETEEGRKRYRIPDGFQMDSAWPLREVEGKRREVEVNPATHQRCPQPVDNLLCRHLDDPDGARHRCVLLDARRLRCLDCRHTLVLPAATSPAGFTSTSSDSPNHHDPDRCPEHVGQWARTCGPCRADILGGQEAS